MNTASFLKYVWPFYNIVHERVIVVFQFKAWCDKNTMKSWVSKDWDNQFLNPATSGSTGKFLFAYIHSAQQISSVNQLLYRNKTVLINIPGGATSRVQLTNHFKIMFENYSRNILMKTLKLI